MRSLELLAPARNADIGIAAIDCGADAVYIAGPDFGARKDAGNTIEDVARLCSYAHRFGCRIFVTFNILLREGEMDEVHRQMLAAQEAGADAFIIRDPRVALWDDIRVPLHASTQCAIRTVERARQFEQAGCSRLILERELPLSTVREIASAVSCEIECFVHGALCVCYSGQCTMSEAISGASRSADRGACIQACRGLYDLVDASGRILVRNKALLSLKDLNLSERLDDLISAGVTSFKIEGRLKNASFVRNTVREYSRQLDGIVGRSGGALRRASFGSVEGGFEPDLSKTFNRGFTELFLDGKRGKWASLDAPKSMGELIGTVCTVRPAAQGMEIVLSGTANLRNGDGFAFVHDGEIVGFRGDICQGNKIVCKPVRGLRPGMELWRNISVEFEKALEANPCRRFIGVTLEVCASSSSLAVSATSEDGRVASVSLEDCEPARDQERASSLISGQLSKRTGHYAFSVSSLDSDGGIPHLGAAALNGLRRELASRLNAQAVRAIPLSSSSVAAPAVDPEILQTGRRAGELMRSKYCIRYELGLCPTHQKDARRPAALQGVGASDPLYLVNNGRRFPLRFDCARCEMAVMAL
jgi:putative protease